MLLDLQRHLLGSERPELVENSASGMITGQILRRNGDRTLRLRMPSSGPREPVLGHEHKLRRGEVRMLSQHGLDPRQVRLTCRRPRLNADYDLVRSDLRPEDHVHLPRLPGRPLRQHGRLLNRRSACHMRVYRGNGVLEEVAPLRHDSRLVSLRHRTATAPSGDYTPRHALTAGLRDARRSSC